MNNEEEQLCMQSVHMTSEARYNPLQPVHAMQVWTHKRRNTGFTSPLDQAATLRRMQHVQVSLQ